MSSFAKLSIPVAAVVVVAVVACSPVGPSPMSAGTPEPSSGPAALLPTSGAIEPGRYRWTAPGGEVTFVVPAGWTASSQGVGKSGEGTEIGLGHNLPGSQHEVTHVYTDACAADGEKGLEPIGPTVANLAEALDDQAGTDATTSSFAGGSRVVIQDAAGLDRSTCVEGVDGPLKIWANDPVTGYFALAPGYRGEVYSFEVGPERFVFSAVIGPDASEADVEGLLGIVESFEFSTP